MMTNMQNKVSTNTVFWQLSITGDENKSNCTFFCLDTKESTKEKIKAMEKTPESLFAVYGGEKQLIPIRPYKSGRIGTLTSFSPLIIARTRIPGGVFSKADWNTPIPFAQSIYMKYKKPFSPGAEKSVTASEIGKPGSTMLLAMNMDKSVEGSYAVV